MKHRFQLLQLCKIIYRVTVVTGNSSGKLYGINYVEAEKAYSKREEIKNELALEYQKHKEPTNGFINSFWFSFTDRM